MRDVERREDLSLTFRARERVTLRLTISWIDGAHDQMLV